MDRGRLVDLQEQGSVVVDDVGGLHALPDHRHVALDDGLALGPELLHDLGVDLLGDGILRGPAGHPVDVAHHGADERDPHHAGLEVLGRGVALGDAERVHDQEVDLTVPDRLAGVAWQLTPDVLGRQIRLQDERAALDQALERVGVHERPVVRGHHDLDVLELGVGQQHRFRAQGDVVVRRCAALLRAVLRCGLRVHPEHPGEDVGEQFAGRDGAVAADAVEADPDRVGWQQDGIRLGLQSHQRRLRVGDSQPVLHLGHVRGGGVGEELRTQVDQRRAVGLGHLLERGDDVARLHVVAAETEDRGGQAWLLCQSGNTVVARVDGVGAGLEQGLGDQAGQRGLVRALQNRDSLGIADRLDEFGFREGLQQFDGHHADLQAALTQHRQHRAHVVGDGAQADHDVVGVVAVVGHDGGVLTACERAVFGHRLPRQGRDGVGEMGPVVDRAGLEVGLVLHCSGEAGDVDVNERGDQLPGALLEGVEPLPTPLPVEFLGDERQGRLDEVAVIVGFDRLG